MKTWQSYRDKSGRIEVVNVGFNPWAFFFPGFWGFAKRLYGAGIIGIFGVLAINRLPIEQEFIGLPLMIVLMLFYGVKGNSWVVSSLTHNDYEFLATLKAANKNGAIQQAAQIMAATHASFTGQNK